VAYSGPDLEYSVTGQSEGTYYYRIMVENNTDPYKLSNIVYTHVYHRIYLPTVLKNYTQTTPGWFEIMTEDFEGNFPDDNGWVLSEGEGTGSGVYWWGARDCQVYEGSYSGWAVGGGTEGSILPCGSNYPNNAESWMEFGPFSLEDANEARLDFMYWVYTLTDNEEDVDALTWGISTDGMAYYSGDPLTGDSDGWQSFSVDLTNVPTLGDVTGEPQVWIAFVFLSNDDTYNAPHGAFIDNIVLRQCASGCAESE
jgi:hypothetical protein